MWIKNNNYDEIFLIIVLRNIRATIGDTQVHIFAQTQSAFDLAY